MKRRGADLMSLYVPFSFFSSLLTLGEGACLFNWKVVGVEMISAEMIIGAK